MAKRYLGGGISFEQKDVYQEFSENEGGGSSTLVGLTDVDISNPTDGQVLVYNAESGKWENGAGGGGGLVVNVIEHNEGEYSSLDKTAGEIYSAFISGNNISFIQSQEDEGATSYVLGVLRRVEYGVFEEGPYAGMGYYNFDVVAVRSGMYFIDNEFQTIGEDTYPVSNFTPPV